MTKDEVLTEALECMEAAIKSGDWRVDGACDPTMTIERMKRALEAKDEPVAWRYDQAKYRTNDLRGRQWAFNVFSQARPYMDEMVQNVTPLYTTPPQRKPLTDDEIVLIIADCAASHQHLDIHLARAIEAAHGIKE